MSYSAGGGGGSSAGSASSSSSGSAASGGSGSSPDSVDHHGGGGSGFPPAPADPACYNFATGPGSPSYLSLLQWLCDAADSLVTAPAIAVHNCRVLGSTYASHFQEAPGTMTKQLRSYMGWNLGYSGPQRTVTGLFGAGAGTIAARQRDVRHGIVSTFRQSTADVEPSTINLQGGSAFQDLIPARGTLQRAYDQPFPTPCFAVGLELTPTPPAAPNQPITLGADSFPSAGYSGIFRGTVEISWTFRTLAGDLVQWVGQLEPFTNDPSVPSRLLVLPVMNGAYAPASRWIPPSSDDIIGTQVHSLTIRAYGGRVGATAGGLISFTEQPLMLQSALMGVGDVGHIKRSDVHC